MEFLNNEDVKKLYIYLKPGSTMTAAKTCQSESSYEKGIFFLKISNTSKLTPENLSKNNTFFTKYFLVNVKFPAKKTKMNK